MTKTSRTTTTSGSQCYDKDHSDVETVKIHVADLADDKYDGHIDDDIKCKKVGFWSGKGAWKRGS